MKKSMKLGEPENFEHILLNGLQYSVENIKEFAEEKIMA